MAAIKTTRIKNACKTYDVSRSTIYRAIDNGLITPTKVGGCLFLSIEQLDQLFLGAALSSAPQAAEQAQVQS